MNATPSLAPLSVDAILAAAVATLPRPATGDVLDVDGRLAVARGAHERAITLANAALAGVQDRLVRDLRCGAKLTVGRFIRHCGEIQHVDDDVVVLDDDVEARDLGRQGESRTAVDHW